MGRPRTGIPVGQMLTMMKEGRGLVGEGKARQTVARPAVLQENRAKGSGEEQGKGKGRKGKEGRLGRRRCLPVAVLQAATGRWRRCSLKKYSRLASCRVETRTPGTRRLGRIKLRILKIINNFLKKYNKMT